MTCRVRDAFALVILLLLAPAVSSQATWFDWRVHPGSSFSQVQVSVDGISVISGMNDPVGSFLGVRTVVPLAGQLSTVESYGFHETNGHVPVFELGSTVTSFPAQPGAHVLVVDVAAGTEIGFGLVAVAPLGDGAASFAPFTFAPAPRLLPGDATGSAFGSGLANLGDLDGDNVDDLAVGAPGVPGGAANGRVLIVSGADGSILLAIDGDASADGFGTVVGAPGADGAGVDAGRAVVLRTLDGSMLFEVAGSSTQADLGAAVARASDVSGDGVADVLLGAPGEDFDPFPGPGSGTARLYSGAAGALLHTWKGTVQGGRFGQLVASGGDLDGDGTPDVLVGAKAGGNTFAYSGATKAALFVVPVVSPRTMTVTSDLDGDGRADFVVGSASSAGDALGRASVYSGRDAARLATFLGPGTSAGFGFAVCSAGDADGDGLDEIAVGAPGADSGPGAVFVHDRFIHWFDVGHALAGVTGAPRLQGHGLPYAGLPIQLSLSAAAPAGPATIVLGTSQIDAPFKGGVLVPSPERLVGGLVTDSAGELVLAGQWPAGLPSGLELFFQAWIVDPVGPEGFAASNGLRVEVP